MTGLTTTPAPGQIRRDVAIASASDGRFSISEASSAACTWGQSPKQTASSPSAAGGLRLTSEKNWSLPPANGASPTTPASAARARARESADVTGAAAANAS